MKTNILLALVFVAGTIHAETLNVKLAASPPASAAAGTTVTLTTSASVVTRLVTTPIRQTTTPPLSYRYTATRTSPCQETMPIGGNGATTVWTVPPTKAGQYNISVTVTRAIPPSGITPGTATTSYTLTNNSGLAPVSLTASSTTGPGTISVSASVAPPGALAYTYRWALSCLSMLPGPHPCSASFPMKEGPQNSASWPSVTISDPGPLRFLVHVDAIGQGGGSCTLNSGSASTQ